MGILNVTPDSFHDGGRFNTVDEALKRVDALVADGADIVDIGAYSTRPGATNIPLEEEWDRLKTILPAIAKAFPSTIISIDTFRSEIASRAIDKGAQIINDISGGEYDTKMFETIAALQVPYILMHVPYGLDAMHNLPEYNNVVSDLLTYFSIKVAHLRELGVHDVIIDPGFGFGKSVEHNYQLLRQLSDFNMLELPILVGVSRKSMINKVLGTKPENALNGTTALHAFALDRGANILRVHDVKEAKQVITLHQHLHR